MKKLLLLLTAAVAAMSLWAAPVDHATAQKKAQSFLKNQLYAGRLMAPAALNPVLLKAEIGDVKLNQPVYYIYNTSTTFLVVAGDDRAEEILMVGDAPLSDINNLSPGMKDMLQQYKKEIMFLQEHPGLKVDPIVSPQNSSMLKAVTIGPLLTCNWGQSAPYYNQCVFTYNNRSYQCVTGCPATSASMVMYFWKYPTTATPSVPGYSMILNDSYIVDVAALPSTIFDWGNMKDSYSSGYTTAQATAVATLMRYVGQAEKMAYGTDGSGIGSDESQNVVNMFKLFGYDRNTCRLVMKNSLLTGATIYSDAEWAAMIQEEMSAGRPIVFMAISNYSGGHAFNVDGYNSSTNKYHINFGWNGDDNAWCSLNSFGTSSWYSSNYYNQYQQMVIGIKPETTEPLITVDPASLEFSATTGGTYTKTFIATGRNLTNNVTLSVSGAGYTVSPTTLTPAQIVSGATITVTYNPTEAGTHEGAVTLSSNGAESQTVTLTGTAIDAPRVTVTPTTLSFNTQVGSSNAKTFNVKGSDLTGMVYLSVSGEGYSLDKSAIGRATAMSTYGSTVKVTFAPTTAGDHPGTITITSAGAETVTITLNGNATDNSPKINVNPAALSFNTVTGESVTRNFIVTGANLTGDLSVALNDDNGVYSVNKTSITPTQATNGALVTVTYSPTAFGNHDATITVSGGGANAATVTLNGLASIAKFTPVMQPVNNDLVNLTSFRADWTDQTYAANVSSYTLEVYAGDASPMVLKATETGGANYRLIEGITPDKYYFVTGLAEGGTFLYRVKALYVDDTESDWSNVEQVTLFANAHPYAGGDVNHDGVIDVDDVTKLINVVLGYASDFCPVCANVTGDGNIDIDDVTALINKVLGNN